MATAFAPLIQEEKLPDLSTSVAVPTRKYDSSKSYKTPLNPQIVPDEFVQLEKRLSENNVGQTSTLAQVGAWVAAAKGDFRGLLNIEEAKRQTAIGKKLAPEIRKINELTNKGEWEKATQYLDTITNTIGPNAKELVPYLQQMAQNINTKQQGWNQLKSLYEGYKGTIPEGSVNYPIVEALGKAVEKRSMWSEATLNNFLTRFTPHTQQIGNRITTTQPMTGAVSTTNLPEMTTGKDTDDYIGQTVAAKNGMTTQQLADLLSGTPVQTKKGIIVPNGSEATRIKDEYIASLPVKARQELVKALPMDPALTIQAIKEVGPEAAALRNFGPKSAENILQGQANRITQAKIAETEGTLAADPYRAGQSGLEVIGGDKKDPSTYLVPQGPMTRNEVLASKGKFKEINREILTTQIQPAYATIQSLDSIPELLGEVTLQTRGDKISTAINEKLSRYLNYPIDDKVEARQITKTILKNAIEQAENIVLKIAPLSNKDKKEIAEMKAFAAGDLKSNKEILEAVERVKGKLQKVIDRAMPGGKPQTPVEAIEGLIPSTSQVTKGRQTQQQGQVTRNPYGVDKSISIPPEVDAEIVKRIKDLAKTGVKGGATTIQIPAPQNPNTPTLDQAPLSDEEKVNKAFRDKAMQRVR